MSLPPESEYVTYEVAMRERYRLWVLYMTKQIEAAAVRHWPVQPQTSPEPVPYCVWHIRPAGMPDNQPVPLSQRYDSILNISGLQFHRKTGYSTLGKNPHRHGRLNWDATINLASQYTTNARAEEDQHNRRVTEISNRLGTEALNQLPSVDATDYRHTDNPRWVKVIRFPGNPKWNIPDCYACGTHYGGPVTLSDISLGGLDTRKQITVEQALDGHNLTDSCVSRILAQMDMVFLTKLDRARKRFLRENLI